MDVAFSIRFQNIIGISKALAKQGQNSDVAKDEATNIEQQFLETAGSLEEYQEFCDDYIDVHQLLASSKPQDETDEATAAPEEVWNTEGPKYSKYEWATFHAEGRTSTIYKAKATDAALIQPVVALKIMYPDRMEQPHNARREARLLEAAKHEHVVPLIEAFWQPGGAYILAFPFLRQDLENLLRSGTLTKAQSQMVFQGLFAALAHLHSKGIVHRDVKPSNILLQSVDGPVYLIDFGIAWSVNDPDSEPADNKITDVGTTCYRPPELLFGDRAYNSSLDMWSAGCVVAEMVRTEHYQLFDAGPLGSELGLIKSMFSTLGTPTDREWPSASKYPDWGKVKFREFPTRPWDEILPGASAEAVDFVQRTVCYESTRRLTAAAALKHPLLASLSRSQD